MKTCKGAAAVLVMTVGAGIIVAGPSNALPPGPAWAPVTGRTSDGGFLAGYFQPGHFTLDANGNLVATGTLTGALNRTGASQSSIDQQISLPVTREPSFGSCMWAYVAVGPADVGLNGQAVHLDQTMLTITPARGPGSRLVPSLCAAGELLNGPAEQTNPGLRDVLNQTLGLLGQNDQ